MLRFTSKQPTTNLHHPVLGSKIRQRLPANNASDGSNAHVDSTVADPLNILAIVWDLR